MDNTKRHSSQIEGTTAYAFQRHGSWLTSRKEIEASDYDQVMEAMFQTISQDAALMLGAPRHSRSRSQNSSSSFTKARQKSASDIRSRNRQISMLDFDMLKTHENLGNSNLQESVMTVRDSELIMNRAYKPT